LAFKVSTTGLPAASADTVTSPGENLVGTDV
jgi:hypothetical protein